MSTDIDIISTALLMVGANQINTLQDSSREAEVAASVYQTTKEAVLSQTIWNFAIGQTTLAKLSETPLFDYQHAFQLPTLPKVIRVVGAQDKRLDYKIFQDKLYSDAKEVKITYLFDPGEENYPPYFRRLLEFALGEIFATALMQDENQAKLFEARADRAMRKARSIDAQNEPPAAIDKSQFVLASVR